MKQVVLLLFIFVATNTLAERIDGPANVRDTINGIVLFQLFDNVEVDTAPLRNNWYQLAITIKGTKEQYEKGTLPLTGDTLMTFDGQKIGIVASGLDSKYYGVSHWHSGKDTYGIDIFGYTFKGNIRPESIIENKIQDLLSNKPQPWDMLVLEPITKEFKFFDIKMLDSKRTSAKELMHSESIVDDPSPMDRIRFILDDSKLIGIVHSRSLTLPNTSDYELVRGRKIIVPDYYPKDRVDEFIQLVKDGYQYVD